jgi:hypothetical protein
MRFISPTRVLIVAHQTADSPALVEAVARRAKDDSCSFTLLVPASSHGLHRVVDPEDHGMAEAERRLEAAIPVLSEAAGSEVIGVESDTSPPRASMNHLPAA